MPRNISRPLRQNREYLIINPLDINIILNTIPKRRPINSPERNPYLAIPNNRPPAKLLKKDIFSHHSGPKQAVTNAINNRKIDGINIKIK
jgi:hypothetical protein